MQISTPTQALSSPESGYTETGKVENIFGDSSAAWSQKAQKKNRSGIFAKLLDGLTAKGKTGLTPKGVAGKDKAKIAENGEGAEAELSPGKTGKNSPRPGLNTKKTLGSGSESRIFDDGFFPGTISAFLKNDGFSSIQTLNSQTGRGEFRSLRKENRPGSIGGDNFLKTATLKGEDLSHLVSGKDDGTKGDLPGIGFGFPANKAGKGASGSAGNSGWDKVKNTGNGNGTANFLSFSFRDLEAQVLHSQLQAGQSKAEGGEKDNTRLSELRGKKGKERLNPANLRLEVRDLRTGEGKDPGSAEASKGQTFSAPRPVNTEIEIPVDLGLPGEKGAEGAAGKTGKGTSQGMIFEDALAGELRGNLSTDIVRDAAVIVRNGGEGTIRLSLRPASLGDVKIRLEMTENKITGHIIVESNEALRAFERELPVLEKAFRDSGFSETNLEMSLAQDGGNFGAGEQGRQGDFSGMATFVSRYDAGADRIDASSDSDASDSGGPDSSLSLQGGAGLSASSARAQVNLLV